MTDNEISYRNILIVDDDPILLSVVEAGFASRGVDSVHVASDGKQALNILDQEPGIDFILCDLNMPNMDGLQFLRHIAERNFHGEIGIASGEDPAVIKSAEILASKYGLTLKGSLQKPLNFTKIGDLLSRSQTSTRELAAAKPDEISRNDLVFAVVNHNILPYYQPKICIRTGQLAGAEALARWEHPELGFIPPAVFIPLAEREGMVDMVTNAIMRETLSTAAKWSSIFPAIKLAVNLSGELLSDQGLPDHLFNMCQDANVDPAQIVLEITESRVLGDSTVPIEVLTRLRMKRFELSVDDFGTGYSNIERLREYPFTELKIDQGFIRNAGNDEFAEKCVRASVDLGRALGLRLVAEGVETVDDYSYVKAHDIDQIQGYYFSKPLPVDAFAKKYFEPHTEVA